MRIATEDDTLVVEVADDGRGGAADDRPAAPASPAWTDRVAALGGTLSVDSPPGGGTRLRAVLPL